MGGPGTRGPAYGLPYLGIRARESAHPEGCRQVGTGQQAGGLRGCFTGGLGYLAWGYRYRAGRLLPLAGSERADAAPGYASAVDGLT
jgi:hypothetical protein